MVVVALSGVPIVIWLVGIGAAVVPADGAALIRMAGKGAALSGLALYSLMPILSMRHRFVERLFGGLDRVYRLHTAAGKISFFLILAHPVCLGLGRLLGGSGLTVIWDWSSLLVILGISSLVGLAVITAFAIYAHIKHQRWIVVHRLFGWLLPLFFVHALVADAQTVHNRTLLTYMLAFGGLGFIAFLYRSVFGRLIKKYHYVVMEVNHVMPTVTELVLKPVAIPISYVPGQFAYMSLRADGMDSEAHPFSFTTANNGPYVRFAVKDLGDDTKHIKELKVGTDAYLEGPYGSFSYKSSKNKQQVWIAGGVGITPFLAMARSLSSRSGYNIHMFYGAEELSDAAFLHELISIRKTIPDVFDFSIVDRQVSGFVTAEMVERELSELARPDYFICGPPAMMQILRDQLIAKGVADQHIYTEEFSML